MFFTECDKSELERMGWNQAQLGAINKHVIELYGTRRHEYSLVDNYRFARVGNRDEEIGYNAATNIKNKNTTHGYDRVFSCNDGSKVMYGFDYSLQPYKKPIKHPYKD